MVRPILSVPSNSKPCLALPTLLSLRKGWGGLGWGVGWENERKILLPGGGEDTGGSVVTGESVNTGLDENELVLLVLVLPELLEVLADGHGLLDEGVEILGDVGGET